jgi:hypothetical protein
MSCCPRNVQWKAQNYNHLHEAPTVFYAVALALALLGAGNGLNATLAWAYVGLRVVHSLVQATVNKVMLRFLIFALSSHCADAADGARRHGGVRLIFSLRSRAQMSGSR